jgi:hypothetical protein
LQQEFLNDIPVHLKKDWEWEFCSFHSPAWWKKHWEKTGKVEVVTADTIPDGWQQWLSWDQVCQEAGYPYGEKDMALLQVDAGRNLGFTRIIAKRISEDI